MDGGLGETLLEELSAPSCAPRLLVLCGAPVASRPANAIVVVVGAAAAAAVLLLLVAMAVEEKLDKLTSENLQRRTTEALDDDKTHEDRETQHRIADGWEPASRRAPGVDVADVLQMLHSPVQSIRSDPRCNELGETGRKHGARENSSAEHKGGWDAGMSGAIVSAAVAVAAKGNFFFVFAPVVMQTAVPCAKDNGQRDPREEGVGNGSTRTIKQ